MLSEIDQIWRAKTDDEVVEAAQTLSEFTDEAQSIIRNELRRRGLPEPEPDAPFTDESIDMRCVYVGNGQIEANQIVAFLESAGIACTVRGESTTKTHGLTVDGLGRAEVLVAETDEEQALALLESARSGAFELDEDEDPASPGSL